MRPLVLVGLMGSGKSTVGTIVAHRTGRAMVDTDVVIRARTGRSVRQLWDEAGAAACRRLESEVVLDALDAGGSTVIAAPGGLVLDPVARHALSSAYVVWLRVDAEVLVARVRSGDHRPLLEEDPHGVLATMARERHALYAEVSDAEVDAGSADAEDVASHVVELLEGAKILHLGCRG